MASKIYLHLGLCALIASFAVSSLAVETEPKKESQKDFVLDKDLQPTHISTKEINKFFKDIVVVQRKAKNKRESILFNPYFQLDFSDGPSTLYSFNMDFGYAFSDFWEGYVNVVPYFLSMERDSVSYVNSLVLVDGKTAKLEYLKPNYQVMAEVLWAPAYGKDSWGPNSIVRSDTFFKFGAGAISYDQSKMGMRFNALLGKTFFIGEGFNFRFAAGGSVVESFVQGTSKMYVIGITELGLIWYM